MDLETEDKLMSTTFTTGQNGAHIVNGRGRPTKQKSYLYLTWLDFAESTTLHGLRYISMSNAFLLRRLIWFVLLVLCVAIMSYQIVDRVIYYHGNPVNVNVRLIYNDSLSFPSITLCNQNAFRASKAAEMNWYRLIESMYKNQANHFNSSHLDNYNASHLPVGLLFETAGHMKEDLIVRCSWGDETCGPENFTAILTDHGLCYTFNHETSQLNSIVATSTGSDHGLKLLLNVEQYEYMPGPNDAAGIKMLIHDQYEYPRVRELGISVPSGTHAFVGLQVVQIENLPPPYGECNERSLKYFKKYTYDACVLECNLQIYKRKCGCRNFYMPHFDTEDDNPVCTLQQYFDCYATKRGPTNCDCPNACHYSLFDPILSYASTSQYSSTKILNSTRFKALKDKLTFAKETTHRMEDDKFTQFAKIVEDVNRTFSEIRLIIEQELQEKIQIQIQQLKHEYKTMMENWNVKNTLYRFQEYNVQKNFIRARDAMEERTFNHLCFDFHKFVYLLNAKIQSLQDQTFNGSDLIYTLAMNSIDNGMSTSQRAFSNYTKLYTAYENGTPIFNYKFPNILRTHNKYSVPKLLMSKALRHNWYARTYGPRMGKDIKKITELLLDYKVLLNTTFHERNLNTFQMENLTTAYIDACECFFHSRSVFYFETIEWPLRVLKSRRSNFDKRKLVYEESYNFIFDNLRRLQYSLTNITTNVIESVAQRIELACKYFNDKSMAKMEIVEGFDEKDLVDSLSLLKSFFFEVRNRGQNIYDGWTQLLTKTKRIWQPILEDNDMMEYYFYTNRSEYLISFFKISEELDSNFSHFRDTNDVRFVVGTADTSFFHTYDILKDHLQAFEASTVVDKAVLRENYLELDVFYRELNYEEIEQQVAYDLFALLCDIGGSMGLFVGASAMTIFELIDLVGNTSAENLFRHQRK